MMIHEINASGNGQEVLLLDLFVSLPRLSALINTIRMSWRQPCLFVLLFQYISMIL